MVKGMMNKKGIGKKGVIILPILIGIAIGLVVLGGMIAVEKMIIERDVTGKAVDGDVETMGGTCFVLGCESDGPRSIEPYFDTDDMSYCNWDDDELDPIYDHCSFGSWEFEGPEPYICHTCDVTGTNCDSIEEGMIVAFVCSGGGCDCTSYLSGFGGGGAVCGNGAVESGETCDGTDLSGQSCAGLGYTGGTLACAGDCLSFDTSGCYSDCGNSLVEIGEECDDGANLTAIICGIGACANSVSDSCVSCLNVTCTAGLPINETCNGIDDNCNGFVDDSDWTRQFGTSGGERAYGIGVDGFGNIYTAGWTDAAFPGQTYFGNIDTFVRKYNSSGSEIWTRQFGTSSPELEYDISADSAGNAYIAGITSGGTLPGQNSSGGIDAYLRKYNSAGSEIWTRQFGSSGIDYAQGVFADSNNVYISGYTSLALPNQTNLGSNDVYVRKYNSSGSEIWTRQFGTASSDWSRRVSADSLGNVYVGGGTQATLPGQSSSGGNDVYIRKYNSAGSEIWTRQFGTANSGEDIYGISIDSFGNVYVGGYTNGAFPNQTNSGDYDIFVRKYNSTGGVFWTRQFGTSFADDLTSVFADSSGGVYISGSIGGGTLPGQTSSGSQDAFVRRYDGNGNILWTRQFGSSGVDYASGVFSDGSVAFNVAGFTNGALPGQTNLGISDAYVSRMGGNLTCPVCGNSIIEGTEECDDGSNSTAISCGVGACANSVSDSCVSCSNVTCTAGTPVTEICSNKLDDDCDGTINDGCGISGGTGGGGHAPIFVAISDPAFASGYSNGAAANSEFTFNVEGEVYGLKISSVKVDGIDEVTVVISGETIKLTIGDKKEVDVNHDGTPDLTVELLSIDGDLANLKVKSLAVIVSQETPSSEIPGTRSPIQNYILGISVVLSILLAIVLLALRNRFSGKTASRKKKKKSKRRN